MTEIVNVTPMVTHALVKSPTPVDENGRTIVEIEIGVPYGFEPFNGGIVSGVEIANGALRIAVCFERKP